MSFLKTSLTPLFLLIGVGVLTLIWFRERHTSETPGSYPSAFLQGIKSVEISYCDNAAERFLSGTKVAKAGPIPVPQEAITPRGFSNLIKKSIWASQRATGEAVLGENNFKTNYECTYPLASGDADLLTILVSIESYESSATPKAVIRLEAYRSGAIEAFDKQVQWPQQKWYPLWLKPIMISLDEPSDKVSEKIFNQLGWYLDPILVRHVSDPATLVGGDFT